jgi:hypothetical protein
LISKAPGDAKNILKSSDCFTGQSENRPSLRGKYFFSRWIYTPGLGFGPVPKWDCTAETRRLGETRGESEAEEGLGGSSGYLWSTGGSERALLNIEWSAEWAEGAEKRMLGREPDVVILLVPGCFCSRAYFPKQA